MWIQIGRIIKMKEILPPINFRDLLDSEDRSFILCDEAGKEKFPNEVLKNKKILSLLLILKVVSDTMNLALLISSVRN